MTILQTITHRKDRNRKDLRASNGGRGVPHLTKLSQNLRSEPFYALPYFMAGTPQVVGQSPPRKEGRAKVLGRAQYIDDITLPGMWFGATVRSTIPRGRITSIAFDPAIPWHEFTIVTAADIPGENTIVHLTKDHPCLASTHVNHAQEPILLLAHPDRAVLPAAVAAVHITYEELPAVYSIEESEKKEQIIWGEGDHTNTFLMQKNQQP